VALNKENYNYSEPKEILTNLTVDGTIKAGSGLSGGSGTGGSGVLSATAPTSPAAGTIWVNSAGSVTGAQLVRWRQQQLSSITVITGSDDNGNILSYTPGYEEVFVNGVLITRGLDYTAVTGTSITLASATQIGDVVEIFNVIINGIAGAYTQAQSDAKYLNKTGGDIITASSTTTVPLTIQGITSQSVDMLDVVNSSNTVIAKVDASGNLTAAGSASFGGSLTTTGANTLGGNTTVSGTLGVSGSANFSNYQTAGKNLIINGGFDWWQYGTSATFTGAYGYYTADRWISYSDTATVTASQISVNGIADGAPAGVRYALRNNRTAGSTLDRVIHIYCIEGALNYVGQSVTLSMYIRLGSGVTAAPNLNLSTRVSKFSATSDAVNTSYPAATFNSSTFTRVSLTLPITSITATNGANLFEIELSWSQAAGTNTYIDVTGMQLEVGTVVTPFTRAAGTVGQEKQACQRYFQTSFPEGVAPQNNYSPGQVHIYAGNSIMIGHQFPVPMRATPSVTVYNPYNTTTGYVRQANSSNDVQVTSVGANGGYGIGYFTLSGGSSGLAYHLHYAASAEI